MKKTKVVKAWGYKNKNGKLMKDCFPTKDDAIVWCAIGFTIVRVSIREITK